MPYYRFKETDIFHNIIKAHPRTVFSIYGGRIFYNNSYVESGSFTGSVASPIGTINLHEQNVDRTKVNTAAPDFPGTVGYPRLNGNGAGPDYIYPFVPKTGEMTTFKTISTGSFNEALYGDRLYGPASLSASISREYFSKDTRWGAAALYSEINHSEASGSAPNRFTIDTVSPDKYPKIKNKTVDISVSSSHLDALRNTFDYYTYLSPHYAYSASHAAWNFGTYDKGHQELNLISIPSTFYGSSIKKGSVHLKWYVSGTLMAECHDREQNGELIQVSGSGRPSKAGDSSAQQTAGVAYDSATGSVAGVVLYNEGFIALTGAWSLNDDYTDKFRHAAGTPKSAESPKWTYFGIGANDGSGSVVTSTSHNVSSSFVIEFEGTQRIPVMTLMAHAPKRDLNHSNNPTFISGNLNSNRKLSRGSALPFLTSSIQYKEDDLTQIRNVVSSSFKDHTGSFDKTTYISQIGIYDESQNLIGVAKLANPIKKTEQREYTFKLKLDI